VTVTIERTSKRIKAAMALGYLALWGGLAMAFIGEGSTREVGLVIFLLSFPWLVLAKTARWWFHE